MGSLTRRTGPWPASRSPRRWYPPARERKGTLVPVLAPGAGKPDPADSASYQRLLAVPGFVPLLCSALLSRTAVQIWAIATVLFALQRYHSAGVAGVSVFLLIFPGLV